jgi:hypothetical protein
MPPTTVQLVVAIWFGLSVIAATFGRLIFALWIWRQGARFRFFWMGTPGYLEVVYASWCRGRGRSSRAGMLMLVGSVINVTLASVAFIQLVAQKP